MIIRTMPILGSTSAHTKPTTTSARVAASFLKLSLVAALAAAVLSTAPVSAQSNVDGAISGKAPGSGSVVIEDAGTGFKRTVNTSADGSFRAASLPPGVYTVSYTDSAGTTHTAQVSVLIGSTSTADFSEDAITLGELRITASPVNPIDFEKIESVTIMTDKQLNSLPVARNATAVQLLAPGTVKGDTAFGNLASFGGASVAENQYFVNGMSISNFRNGLDPSLVPFDAYSQFEVFTGAYSAQYGRSTGGIVNATTKRGSNTFHGGINLYFEPDSLRANSPDSYYAENFEAIPLVYNQKDYAQTLEGNVWVSGPAIKDKLFFYALYNVRQRTEKNVFASSEQFEVAKSDDPFWLVKIDAVPFNGHRIEYTGFQDERTWTYRTSTFDFATNRPLDDVGLTYDDRGGLTHTARYTGTFFDRLTVSAQYGINEQDRSSYGDLDFDPAVYDTRTGRNAWVSGNPSLVVNPASSDERKMLRFDAEYSFDFAGRHRLRFGFDSEKNTTRDESYYSGGVYYRYYTRPAGFSYNGGVFAEGGDVVRVRVLENSGSFDVKSRAYYLEDNWTTWEDRLTLRLGVRNERFENFNKEGGSFIRISNQWAPRIGATFDLFGDRRTKLSINFGRYHLPVASNTNARLSGGELFTEEYFVLSSINDDWTPVLGAKIGGTTVYSDGEIPDVRTIVDTTIKPMFQDEWMISLQHQLTKNLIVGIRGTARELGTAIDDMIVDHALVEWGVRNGYGTREELEGDILGSFHYVLGNPGKSMTTAWDFDFDGNLEIATLTREDLGYPKAIRKYYSAELFAEKVWDGKWYAQASYTWSHSYGNTEGWVLSDNGQDDAGITILYDTPALTDLSKGNLPNDVRHYFKLFGSYALTNDIQIGLNTYLKSGRPINRFVNMMDPVIGTAYGNDYFGVPRGTEGTTPWVFNADLMIKWMPKNLPGFLGDRVTFGVDVFNILNADAATEVYEYYEQDQAIGLLNPRWGRSTSFQAPRSVRFMVSMEF